MKNWATIFVMVLLVAVMIIGVGCDEKPQTPQTNTVPTEGEGEILSEGEVPEEEIVGSLVIKGSLSNPGASKAYSDATVANFISEMARLVDLIEYKIGNLYGEETLDVNGNFNFSIDNLTLGQYQMRVTAGCKATGRQFFVWEGSFMVSGRNQHLTLVLEPIKTFELTIIVTNLPQTCSTGPVENGRCYLIDENGDAYEATTPKGSGCSIYRLPDGNLTLCAMAEFPLSAEITSVIVTDDYGTPFQTAYQFNCLDWIDRNAGWATFPDEIILDVEIGLNTQAPPTLYIETAEDGWDYAWLDCGNFVFSAGWEQNETGGPGFVNPGCHIYTYSQLGFQEIPTTAEEAVQLDYMIFYIMWSCGSPYDGYIEDYSVRVIRNGVIISPRKDEQGNLFYY